jgi:hypothetical protein
MHLRNRIITILILLAIPLCAGAEVIVLKDGTRIEAEKVWEDNGYIKFSPEGYEGVVITYDKEIVDRIGDRKIGAPDKPAAEIEQPAESNPDGPTVKAPASDTSPPKGPARDGNQPRAEPLRLDPQPVKPATPDAGQTSAPPSVGADAPSAETPAPSAHKQSPAIPSPAPQPPAARKKPAAPAQAAAAGDFSQFDGIEFYDPRRTYKYQTAPNTWHRTLEEALAALAATFEQSPEWVGQNIGNTNNLGQIYRNLKQSASRSTDRLEDPATSMDGVDFYDPRRQYKYWIGKEGRYRTLEDALEALADRYDRTPAWVQEHIGETNDLGQIHRNLDQSKAAETRARKTKK